jgi:hypothetical protein
VPHRLPGLIFLTHFMVWIISIATALDAALGRRPDFNFGTRRRTDLPIANAHCVSGQAQAASAIFFAVRTNG